MLGLPSASVFEMRVPKNKIVETLPPRSRLKRLLAEQIDAIHWRHALTEESTRLPAGKPVQEIDVLEIVARTPRLERDVLLAVDSAFPRPTVLVVTTPVERLLAMCYKEIRARRNSPPKIEILAFYSTPLPDPDAPAIRLEGYDLDAARDNFPRQIAGDARAPFPHDMSIKETLNRAKERDALLKKIGALENKIRREKQFNRQVELSDEKRKLEQALDDLLRTSTSGRGAS